jgi:glucosyl-dolichyl phosphate glucuronosyltransferase
VEFVSVIIPTRNRSRLLERCLESLTAQTAPTSAFEVLVIDNGSSDDTAQVVAKFAGRVPALRHIWEPQPGLHRGRNRGMSEARGRVLLFGDDDIRATPTWVEGIAKAFERADVALATGNAIPDYEESPPAWLERLWTRTSGARYLGCYSVIDFGSDARDISPFLVWGCNFGVRADVLRELGGFNPDGMPSELAMYRGDGETAVSRYVASRDLIARYEPSASVFHWVSRNRLKPEYLIQRAQLQGISDSYSVIRARGAVSTRDVPRACARALCQFLRTPSRPFGLGCWLAYWRGFTGHRRATRDDPVLLAWVLSRSYLEAAQT